jgi:predicted dehydrogenase
MQGELGLGVIGFGGFAQFAMQQFIQVPSVRLSGMAGTHRDAAISATQRFGVEDIEDVDELLASKDVDLVYIATPPFLHYPQALAALRAGKHVICEKPLAMKEDEANELIKEAEKRDLLLVANLMQRYNPLFDVVKTIIDERLLGEPLHGYFENYAVDEALPEGHWFWDREKSGGIFIEHGVHFFDLFAGWLGPGEVVAAQACRRPQSGVEEQVQATVRYGDGLLVNFYHGFHQPRRLDRQELKLVFERGDIVLNEWIPFRYHIHAIADEAHTRRLIELLPAGRLHVLEGYSASMRKCQGRFKEYDVYQEFDLRGGSEQRKSVVYGNLLRELFADQLAWIVDHNHQRRVTEANGRDSLLIAEQADRLAHGLELA